MKTGRTSRIDWPSRNVKALGLLAATAAATVVAVVMVVVTVLVAVVTVAATVAVVMVAVVKDTVTKRVQTVPRRVGVSAEAL
jgi:Flp pilus assembly protein TadB